MKRSALKTNPQQVAAWKERSRRPLNRVAADLSAGGEGQRSSRLRRVAIPPDPHLGPSRSPRDGQPAWWKGEIRGTLCVVCEERKAQHGHHIIPVSVLKREAKSHGFVFKEVLWDRRNRLGLCAHCHFNHHGRMTPIPQTVLRAVAHRVYSFADELGLRTFIDREYPDPQPNNKEANNG